MKSFKNFYIRNNNLVELQNTSFESPLITTNSFLYYNSFTQTQKDNFKWTAGGNWLDPQGPVMVNSVTVWGFSNPYPYPYPYPSSNQCIGLQSSSFIQQSMYLASGQHTISLYYHTRSMDNANSINIEQYNNRNSRYCSSRFLDFLFTDVYNTDSRNCNCKIRGGFIDNNRY